MENNLIGKTIGDLKILCYANKKSKHKLYCACSCGEVLTISTAQLKSWVHKCCKTCKEVKHNIKVTTTSCNKDKRNQYWGDNAWQRAYAYN